MTDKKKKKKKTPFHTLLVRRPIALNVETVHGIFNNKKK